MRGGGAIVLSLVLVTGCATRSDGSGAAPTPPPATPCEQVIPDCRAERLPNVLLVEGTPAPAELALGPVTGSIDGTIDFDEALRRAWQEDGQRAKTVQVVLGSADPEAMNWDSENHLFYGVIWGGVCLEGSSLFPPSPGEDDTCDATSAGTILDAYTGEFVVSG
jgi:hypothetical protein